MVAIHTCLLLYEQLRKKLLITSRKSMLTIDKNLLTIKPALMQSISDMYTAHYHYTKSLVDFITIFIRTEEVSAGIIYMVYIENVASWPL